MESRGTLTYNITYLVDYETHKPWRSWLLENHIPMIMGTGCFDSWAIMQILETESKDGLHYALQFKTSSMERLEDYRSNYATSIMNVQRQKFMDHCLHFSTVMKTVEAGINEDPG